MESSRAGHANIGEEFRGRTFGFKARGVFLEHMNVMMPLSH